jgi:DNA polymerase-1
MGGQAASLSGRWFGLIFRAYHRLPPLTNPHGVPVGAVYGYTTMLWKLADDLHKADGPTHLAVILDKGAISFRNQLYDQYKANRPPPPEDLVPQFPLIRDATRAFSLPCIEEDNLEADDLIASYAREATRRGWDVTIVSSDKDLMQLVGRAPRPTTDRGRLHRHARHDEEPADRHPRGGREVRRPARAGRRRARADGRLRSTTCPDLRHRPEDREQADPGLRHAHRRARRGGGDEARQAARPADRRARDGRAQPGAGATQGRLPAADGARRLQARQVPKEPLAEFLTAHGFTSLLKRLDDGKGSPDRPTQLNPAKQDMAGAPATAAGNRQPPPSGRR